MAKYSESKILFWLNLASVSVKKKTELLKRFGGATNLWEEFTKKSLLVREVLGDKAYAELVRYRNPEIIEKSLIKLRDEGIFVLTVLNPLYPKQLLQPEVSAPLVLYYKGDLNLLKEKIIAVVGTRACTTYGKDMANKIGTDLANGGVTVVSGIATGIDTYAHNAVMNAGGKSIAVLPCGFNKISPVSSATLVDKIIKSGGLVISEYKRDFEATKYTFPERNRLISGLSMGVVIVEAAEKSGALITANLALEQNREVFAVPGNITSTRSAGCNNLLYEGANFIRNGQDVLAHFDIKSEKTQNKNEQNAENIVDKDEKKVYILLEEGDKTLDELVENSGLEPKRLSEILLNMELDDLIVRKGANLFALKQ